MKTIFDAIFFAIYNDETIKKKAQKNKLAMGTKSISELENDLKELNDREKIRKEIEELSSEPISLSKYNKAFYRKSRYRKLACIPDNIYRHG